MAMIKKGQQLAGPLPDADALGRARCVLEGTLSEADAYAKLDTKHGPTAHYRGASGGRRVRAGGAL